MAQCAWIYSVYHYHLGFNFYPSFPLPIPENKTVATALTAVGALPQSAHAGNLKYLTPTPSDVMAEDLLTTFYITLLIFMFVFLSHYIYRLICNIRNQYSRQIFLCLELSTITDTIVLYLWPLIHMPSEYSVFADLPMQNVQLLGILTPTLKILWPTLRIFRRTCPTDIIKLPEYLILTYLQSFRIRRMLTSQYSATLLIKFCGRFHHVHILHSGPETQDISTNIYPNLVEPTT
jgi:hypothetical protein